MPNQNKKKNIAFIFRKPFQHNKSIESVFYPIIDYINSEYSDHYIASAVVLPFHSNSNFKRLLNIFYCFFIKYDVYHITGDVNYISIFFDKQKTISTFHDFRTFFRLKGIFRFVFKYLYILLPSLRSKYITFVSKKSFDDFLLITNNSPVNTIVIPNYVRLNFTSPKVKNYGDISKFLFVGTGDNKNLSRVIQALSKFKASLTIVGFLNESYISQLKKYNINYNNYLNVSDEFLSYLYQRSHVLLFPSIFEGFGLPVIEGQASGCIVVTSKIEPLISISNGCSVLCDPFCVDSIISGIKHALELTKSQDYLNLAFDNTKKYSLHNVVSNYVDLYEKI